MASKYTELAAAKISENRQAVISQREDGSFTIGQRMSVDDEGQSLSVFLRGGLHVSSKEGLMQLRDALNYVLVVKK